MKTRVSLRYPVNDCGLYRSRENCDDSVLHTIYNALHMRGSGWVGVIKTILKRFFVKTVFLYVNVHILLSQNLLRPNLNFIVCVEDNISNKELHNRRYFIVPPPCSHL